MDGEGPCVTAELDTPRRRARAGRGNQIDAVEIVAWSEGSLWITRTAPPRTLANTNPRDGGEERYSLERFGNPMSRHHARLSRSRDTGPETGGLNVNDADTSKV